MALSKILIFLKHIWLLSVRVLNDLVKHTSISTGLFIAHNKKGS